MAEREITAGPSPYEKHTLLRQLFDNFPPEQRLYDDDDNPELLFPYNPDDEETPRRLGRVRFARSEYFKSFTKKAQDLITGSLLSDPLQQLVLGEIKFITLVGVPEYSIPALYSILKLRSQKTAGIYDPRYIKRISRDLLKYYGQNITRTHALLNRLGKPDDSLHEEAVLYAKARIEYVERYKEEP